MTVTPTTGLADGQTVTVAGSGFTPNTLIGIAMCKAGTTFSLLDCEIANPTWFTNDTAGAFTHTYNVRAHITTGHGAIDCTVAPRTCVLGVVNTNDYSEFSLTSLSFGTETGPTPEVTIDGTTVREGTGGRVDAAATVTLSEPTDHVVRVFWETVDGSAHNGTDFDYSNDVLSFAPGETQSSVTVKVIGDATDEPTERFKIQLRAPYEGFFGATLGDHASPIRSIGARLRAHQGNPGDSRGPELGLRRHSDRGRHRGRTYRIIPGRVRRCPTRGSHRRLRNRHDSRQRLTRAQLRNRATRSSAHARGSAHGQPCSGRSKYSTESCPA